jgi:hypothetical protein
MKQDRIREQENLGEGDNSKRSISTNGKIMSLEVDHLLDEEK